MEKNVRVSPRASAMIFEREHTRVTILETVTRFLFVFILRELKFGKVPLMMMNDSFTCFDR